jgi:hypothetical protein
VSHPRSTLFLAIGGPDSYCCPRSTSLGDDPSLSRLKIEWSPISGPGNVSFTNSHALDTEASFSEYGAYVLQLSVDNGQLPPALAQITIHVNQVPVISASADTIVTLPANGTLSGEVVYLGWQIQMARLRPRGRK